tara:strand:+ start:1143 stop:1565 length:423 start_codon:yes stop_codon:yes gene_type:complete
MNKKSLKPANILTIKQRLFCRYVAQGMSNRMSAIEAGYADSVSTSDTAYKLMKKPDIVREIERVSTEIALKERVSLAHHVSRMQDLSQKAEDAGQYGSAIQAEHYAGKVSRLYVDQSHVVSEKREAPEVILERLNSLVGG